MTFSTSIKQGERERGLLTNFGAAVQVGRTKCLVTLAQWWWEKQSGHQTRDSPYLRTGTRVGYRRSAVHPITSKTFLGYLQDWFLWKCVSVCVYTPKLSLAVCCLPVGFPNPPLPVLLSPAPLPPKRLHLQKIPTTTDTHPAKSKWLRQKCVKSPPFARDAYWRGRINRGWNSSYFSSS